MEMKIFIRLALLYRPFGREEKKVQNLKKKLSEEEGTINFNGILFRYLKLMELNEGEKSSVCKQPTFAMWRVKNINDFFPSPRVRRVVVFGLHQHQNLVHRNGMEIN